MSHINHLQSSAAQNRLQKIEGQIKGIRAMMDSERECADIIMQLSSVSAAVTSLAKLIVNEHLERCVLDGIKSGDEKQTIEDLVKVVDQFAKMK